MSQCTLYFNGKIYTMDENNTCVSAMLVTDGRIAAVGRDSDLLAAKPADAELIDLKGRVVLPGLIDGHSHVSITGRCIFELQLSGKSKAEVLEMVRKKAEELPAGDWICGVGWNQDEWNEKGYPTKEELDAVAPNHPVRLVRYCGNAYWCNSLAINMALEGASDDEENSGTEFMLNEKGELAGTLVGPLCRKIDDIIPEYTEAQYGAMYNYIEAICLSYGTTTIMEKGAGAQSPLTVTGGKKIVKQLRSLYDENKLKIRIHQAVIGLDPYADEHFGQEWEPFSHDDHLSVRSVKFWTDGAFGAHSACLSEDYYDQPGHRGNRKFSDEELTALFKKYDDLGVQIEVHTIGDATTTQVLDCYEAAFADSLERDRRFIIDHVHVAQPEDIIRMGRLNLINSTQFIQFSADMGFLPVVLSPDMVKLVYPWRAVLDAGCRMVNGADMDPVSPFLMLYVAIARKNVDGINTLEEEPLKTLTRMEAIRTMTTETAYAMFMEDRLGSLEPGKHADFIFIDRDYFTCPEEEIRDITVEATYIAGKQVYAR